MSEVPLYPLPPRQPSSTPETLAQLKAQGPSRTCNESKEEEEEEETLATQRTTPSRRARPVPGIIIIIHVLFITLTCNLPGMV